MIIILYSQLGKASIKKKHFGPGGFACATRGYYQRSLFSLSFFLFLRLLLLTQKEEKKKKVSENMEAALIKKYTERSVKTMASFVSMEAARTKSQWKQWPGPLPSATSGGARKPPGPKRKKSVKPMASFASTEKNGQLWLQPSPTPWVLTTRHGPFSWLS